MKKILIVLLILILISLLVLLGFAVYIYINIKPFLLSGDQSVLVNSSSNSNIETNNDKHPLLTNDQEATLEKFGIDPAKLPTEITPAMESCFIDKLGQDRVNEIKSGQAEPGVLDFFKAKDCVSN